MTAVALALGLATLAAPEAPADSWSFESEERVVALPGGGRVVVSVDASRSTQQPDFEVVIESGNSPPVSHPGLWFRDVVASPDGLLIVGLSNRGIPDSAAAVFSLDGALLLIANHDAGALNYCKESVTLVREWYDGDDPDVHFGAPAEPGAITLRDCRGERLTLLEALGASQVASDR